MPDGTDEGAAGGRQSADAVEADIQRLEAIKRTRGALTGTFPPGSLDDIRQDWAD